MLLFVLSSIMVGVFALQRLYRFGWARGWNARNATAARQQNELMRYLSEKTREVVHLKLSLHKAEKRVAETEARHQAWVESLKP